jgi:hypothetical protein
MPIPAVTYDLFPRAADSNPVEDMNVSLIFSPLFCEDEDTEFEFSVVCLNVHLQISALITMKLQNTRGSVYSRYFGNFKIF